MPASFSLEQQQFMQQALDLALKGQFTTSPNPAVGCVLVKDNQIVGAGFHARAGQPHAEVMALQQAGARAEGCTAYVTLEPCAHFGRTPPCAKALIEAGVSHVVAAILDPNPLVAGKGLQMLQDAGVSTAFGLLAEQAERINKGFLTRMRTGKPLVQLKMAMTIDGKTATATGESKWITSELARADVQAERARASAILSASGTVLADNPSLTVRWQQLPPAIQAEYGQHEIRQPVRVILDSQHRVTPQHHLFASASPIWLVGNRERNMASFPDFCESINLTSSSEHSQLSALLLELGHRQINTLWVEAGAHLAGALIEENLVDELIVYVAPKLLGEQARGLCQLPHIHRLSEAPLWQLESVEQIGQDVKMRYCRASLDD